MDKVKEIHKVLLYQEWGLYVKKHYKTVINLEILNITLLNISFDLVFNSKKKDRFDKINYIRIVVLNFAMDIQLRGE